MKGFTLRWLAVGVLLLVAGAARADDRYYMLVFGSQRTPLDPSYSHTFALFVQVGDDGTLDGHYISWLPRTLDIRPLALRPELGGNLPIFPTLQWAVRSNQRVSLWGPFEIKRELYCKAVAQQALLECGKIKYMACDGNYFPDEVQNSIHAVSAIAGGLRYRTTILCWGETASYHLVRRFKPWIICPDRTHDWLIPTLGLYQFPITYRDLEDPGSGGFPMLARQVTGQREPVRGRHPAP
jgi:hypothetical protein